MEVMRLPIIMRSRPYDNEVAKKHYVAVLVNLSTYMKQRLERGEPRYNEQDAVESLLEAVRVKARHQLLRGCVFYDDGTSLRWE
jgi:hypothetical protein